MINKICKFCDNQFNTNSIKKIFCCNEHKVLFCQEKQKKIRAQKRQQKERKCLFCNKNISDLHHNAKFCSDDCLTRNREKENLENSQLNSTGVICALCGFKSDSLVSHITRTHKISINEYKTKYPNSAIVSEKYSKFFSEKISGNKNPAWKHGGRLSPVSKQFLKYIDDTADEQILKVKNKAATNRKNNHGNTTNLEYYTSRGFTIEEATDLLSKRQSTFSLQKCIEKYGEIDGTKRWSDRQKKWLSSYKKQNYSKISQELFWSVFLSLDYKTQSKCTFATLSEDGKEDYTGTNHESIITSDIGNFKPDFLFDNKIIEFDGDYWHSSKFTSKNTNKIRHDTRQQKLESMGYQILRIKEHDYRNDPERSIRECICFLTA